MSYQFNRKMFGPTGIYPSKAQPNICAKTCAPRVISLTTFEKKLACRRIAKGSKATMQFRAKQTFYFLDICLSLFS